MPDEILTTQQINAQLQTAVNGMRRILVELRRSIQEYVIEEQAWELAYAEAFLQAEGRNADERKARAKKALVESGAYSALAWREKVLQTLRFQQPSLLGGPGWPEERSRIRPQASDTLDPLPLEQTLCESCHQPITDGYSLRKRDGRTWCWDCQASARKERGKGSPGGAR